MRAIFLGILASFFFAFTFVLNRAMDLSGGSWVWSAVLRYLFMVPFLVGIVAARGNLRPLLRDLRARPLVWCTWSVVGFGLFYAPLCFAAAYGPGWLIAGTWQLTIVAGLLLAPCFWKSVPGAKGPVMVRQRIPVKGLAMSTVILAGVGLMQAEQARALAPGDVWLGVLPVVAAAFAYPLGNRKMMEACQGRFDPYQRVLGMTLASMPFWLLLSLYGLFTHGLPGAGQTAQSLVVAVTSGVIATALFFAATDRVREDGHKLAAVEATQSGEVVFAVLLEFAMLAQPFPSGWSLLGMVLIIAGMTAHSFASRASRRVTRAADL